MRPNGRFARLELTDFLSFGPEKTTFDLLPLNVLIGPNATGKSNVVDAFRFLRACVHDLHRWMAQNGGISNVLYNGAEHASSLRLSTVVDYDRDDGEPDLLLHNIVVQRPDGENGPVRYGRGTYHVPFESVFFHDLETEDDLVCFDRLTASAGRYRPSTTGEANGTGRAGPIDLDSGQSVLAQLLDPRDTAIGHLQSSYRSIRTYADWSTGPGSPVRRPSPIDLPNDALSEDMANLANVLHRIQSGGGGRLVEVNERFRDLYSGAEGWEGWEVREAEGYLHLFLCEEGGREVSARRASSGSLRFLGLLLVLTSDDPAPLTLIEEPETGLHPDLLGPLGRLLEDASERSQFLVTTHSDRLVDVLRPDHVVVCERQERGTSLQRLDPERLKTWLESFRLGELWTMGEIGGNRW